MWWHFKSDDAFNFTDVYLAVFWDGYSVSVLLTFAVCSRQEFKFKLTVMLRLIEITMLKIYEKYALVSVSKNLGRLNRILQFCHTIKQLTYTFTALTGINLVKNVY